jgi:hypothetical protein
MAFVSAKPIRVYSWLFFMISKLNDFALRRYVSFIDNIIEVKI